MTETKLFWSSISKEPSCKDPLRMVPLTTFLSFPFFFFKKCLVCEEPHLHFAYVNSDLIPKTRRFLF